MRRAAALGLVTVLAGCGPASGPGKSAELESLLNFAAYPGGKLVGEGAYGGGVGPFAMPATSGYREYETDDAFDAITRHYAELGEKHGWTVAGRAEWHLATLTKDRRQIDVRYDPDGGWPEPDATPSPPYRLRIEAYSR